MIENLDYNIGRIIEALRQNDLSFDTHIMFFSDHGDMLGSHGQFRKTIPYEEPDSAFLQSLVPTMHKDSINKAWRGIITKDGWKYVCFEGMPWLLFNLKEDPYEQVNLAHNQGYANKMRELNNKLQEWIKKTEDKFLLPVI